MTFPGLNILRRLACFFGFHTWAPVPSGGGVHYCTRKSCKLAMRPDGKTFIREEATIDQIQKLNRHERRRLGSLARRVRRETPGLTMSHLRIASLPIPDWPDRPSFVPRSYGPEGPHTVWLHSVAPGVLQEFLRETISWHRQMNLWQLFVACVSTGALVDPTTVQRILVGDATTTLLWDSDVEVSVPVASWVAGRPDYGMLQPPQWPSVLSGTGWHGRPSMPPGAARAFGSPVDLRCPSHRKALKLLIKDLHRAQRFVTPVEAAKCRQIENYLSFYLSASGGPVQ